MRRARPWELALGLVLAWGGTAMAQPPEPPAEAKPEAVKQVAPRPSVQQQMRDMKRGGPGRILRNDAPAPSGQAGGGQGLKPPPELQRRTVKPPKPEAAEGRTPPPAETR